ncbi:class IV adenylate cyclase [Candidatus Peregrinibacteria bacterium]|nr:class IV adenylate cyclase [Candidatus Peregrinibacteria bacterium]
MKEIERKILEIDKRKLFSRIKTLKPRPRKIFEGKVTIRYFDFPDGRIRKKRDLLRLRVISPKGAKPFTELVYKTYLGIKKGCKYFDELEFPIPGSQDFERLTKFFAQLGLKKTVEYEKKRTLYAQGKVHFEIDEHPKIPAFLEIEAPSPQHIEKAIRQLGLENHEQTAESIGELLKRKYPKISLNGLKF